MREEEEQEDMVEGGGGGSRCVERESEGVDKGG